MPKIKDLGIKVIPETMRPPEAGGGGAGCGFFTCGVSPAAARACLPTQGCSDCTVQQFSICGTSPGGGCSDCTNVPFSICGTTPGIGCSDCTIVPFSICGTTPHGCTDCTVVKFSICGTTGGGCTDCTVIPFSICGGTGCGPSFCACTPLPHTGAGCGPSVACRLGTIRVTFDPTIWQQPGITVEQIATLKESLRKQIAALEEHEKTLGPKTHAEIDAREKQLNDELAQLKARRKDLK
jgi:hypothetical protein